MAYGLLMLDADKIWESKVCTRLEFGFVRQDFRRYVHCVSIEVDYGGHDVCLRYKI